MTKMNLKNSFPLFLSAIVSIMITGCSTTRVRSPEGQPVQMGVRSLGDKGAGQKHKVALLLPLSGPHKQVGQDLLKAAEIALFDTGNENLEIQPLNTKGTPLGAINAMQTALNNNVELVLGPVFANNTRAIRSMARNRRIPIITFSTDLSIAGNGVYVFGFDVIEQIKRIAEYAKSKGIHRIAAVLPNTPYGKVIRDEMQRLNRFNRLDLVGIVFYSPHSRDFTTTATALRRMKYDSLFVPEGGKNLQLLLEGLVYNEIDLDGIQLLGTGQWETSDLIYNHYARGGWFSTPYHRERATFTSKFRSSFGGKPVRIASLAYDAVSMVAMLVRREIGHPFSHASLIRDGGFRGVDGLFRLLASGDTERGLAILKVTANHLKVLSLAPQKF